MAPSLVRSGAVLGAANVVANGCAYVLSLVLSRVLGPEAFGGLAAVLAVGLILAIPAGALQVVGARWRARSTGDPAHGLGQLVLGAGVGVGLLLVAGVVAVPAAALLHLPGPVPVLWLGVTLVPMTATGALQGWLLGGERYWLLAAAYVVVAATRLLAGVAAAAWGLGVDGVLALIAAAAALALAVVAGFAGAFRWRGRPRVALAQVGELAGAAGGLAGLLVLTNLDLLLARHYLGATESGLYAVGSLFARAALWGPQFVALLVVPRRSRDGRRPGLLGNAVGATVAIGLLVVATAALLGGPLVRLTSGPAYGGIAGSAWLFAALGVLAALVQLMLYAGLAEGSRRFARYVWAAAVAELLLVAGPLHGSIGAILAAALATSTVLVACGLVLERAPASATTAHPVTGGG
jgi:O-antigen/teichoic acid export membrane protein